jgi:NADPH:quinone reductase-like Zn-dependent oxidoreductase
MRALVHDGYTSAAGLAVAEVPTPRVGADRVLVRVLTASVNPVDWHLYRGDPWIMRLRRPGAARQGLQGVGEDFAGVVAEVGAGVTGVAVGERVFGTIPATAQRTGSIAEYVDVDPEWFAVLPPGVDPSAAAASSLAGLTAMQALRDAGGLEPGGRVLVWGAAGGVGHLAVQIARLLGASRVDAVCSARSIDMVRGLGADDVFDYTVGETPRGPYDVVIDTVCTARASTLRRILAPEGVVVTIGAAGGGRILGPGGPIVRRAVGSALARITARTVLTRVDSSDLARLGSWLQTGALRVVLERVFPLAQAPAAYEVLEEGRVRGKLVIDVSGAPAA